MAEKAAWSGKTRGGVLGYKIFNFILKYLGLGFAYFILRFVAIYFVVFAPKASRAIFYYFNSIWKFPKWQSWTKVYKSYFVFGKTLLDKAAILAGYSNKFTFFFDGEDHLRQLAKEGKGGILISAHIGNWEIAGHFLKKVDNVVNVVMFDGEHQKVKAYMDDVMVERKFNIIVVKDDFSHLFEIHKALSNNEFICIHGDRYVAGPNVKLVKKEFMGKEAYFPAGPFELAARLKVPYTFVFAIKETDTHYHFYATPGQIHQGGRNIDGIVSEYVKSLEKMLHQFPYQWFNFYNFWDKPKL